MLQMKKDRRIRLFQTWMRIDQCFNWYKVAHYFTIILKLDNHGHLPPYTTRLPPEGGLYGLPLLLPIATKEFLFRVF
ncbi:MAG: hypothetical protein ACFFD2_11600 [Promethearchaeota archaeon]